LSNSFVFSIKYILYSFGYKYRKKLNQSKIFVLSGIFLKCRTTGNVLLKCGLLHLKFLLKTARSKKCFPLTKLIKKWRRKHFLRQNFTKFSTQEPSIPHFSNTMLCAVFFNHSSQNFPIFCLYFGKLLARKSHDYIQVQKYFHF